MKLRADAALHLPMRIWDKAQAAWRRQMSEFRSASGIDLPNTVQLSETHLENCRVLPHREAILQRMKTGAIVAEVGVQTGRFSQEILDLCQPAVLHLLDLDLGRFSIGRKFKSEIEAGRVQLHEGDSSTMLRQFPDAYFDFIYIDGDHSYPGVRRDLEVAKTKINQEGTLILNDYTYWSPVECARYGVIQAVNELCIEEGWEVIYFALAPYMYCDVAIRRKTR